MVTTMTVGLLASVFHASVGHLLASTLAHLVGVLDVGANKTSQTLKTTISQKRRQPQTAFPVANGVVYLTS